MALFYLVFFTAKSSPIGRKKFCGGLRDEKNSKPLDTGCLCGLPIAFC